MRVGAGLRVVPGACRLADDVVAVGFVDEDGIERHELLEDCAQQGFESGPPVRTFPSFHGQRNWPGWWWSATTSSHVGYESWLERDHAMALDFDADVVAFAAQPFWLFLQVDGQRRSHAPDFFARHRDGTATVLDCRPDERIKPCDAAVFDATAQVCEDVGWSYRRVGALPEVEAMNLRWLAGYRQRRFAVSTTAVRLRAMFAIPRPMMTGAASCGPLPTVLPVLFHLLWHHRLRTDLTTPLTESSVLTTTSADTRL